MTDVFVDFVKQEELPECPHDPKQWESGYGLAGGGMGLYMYCPLCERVVEKSQDHDFDTDPKV